MSNGSVGDGKFTKVVTNHLRLDVDMIENLAVVDRNLGVNHFRDDEHIAQVGLNDRGLIKRATLRLCLAKLLDERHGLSLQASLHASSGTSMDIVQEFLVAEIKELVQFDSTKSKLLELSLLSKSIEAGTEGKSYIVGDYAIHCVVDSGTRVWFTCMAERAMGRRLPFAFLAALQCSFGQWYAAPQVAAAEANGMQAEFRPEIEALVEKYNAPNADRVACLMEKVQHINDNIMESIDKILERQDKIDLLVNRSQLLSNSSASFRREAVRVRNAVRSRHMRMWGIIGAVILAVILVVIWASCGITFGNCR